MKWIILLLAITLPPVLTTEPSTQPIDPQLLDRLHRLDERMAKIEDLTADFQQEKFTALLKKPLISTGRVRVKGPLMRWDTEHPEPMQMSIDPAEMRLYYPAQKTVEIYNIGAGLAQLAASPLPRLDVMQKYFRITQSPAPAGPGSLSLRLDPTDPSLRRHLLRVDVLLDETAGHIKTCEMTDPDGDRTVISFSNVRINIGLGDRDLRLQVPPGTTESRPLDGMDGGQPPDRGTAR